MPTDPNNGLEAIAFDLDGTLIDASRAHGLAYKHAFASAGIDVPDDAYQHFAGESIERVIAGIAGGQRLPLPAEELHRRKTQAFSSLSGEIRPLGLLWLATSGALEIATALVTSATRDTAAEALARWCDLEVFDVVVAAEDTTEPKPSAQPYLLAAELLGASPKSMLAFEDSNSGIRAARAAGCIVVPVAADT